MYVYIKFDIKMLSLYREVSKEKSEWESERGGWVGWLVGFTILVWQKLYIVSWSIVVLQHSLIKFLHPREVPFFINHKKFDFAIRRTVLICITILFYL